MSYIYFSRVTNTHLKLEVTDGLLTVHSESVIPITIIKDILTRMANESSVALSQEWEVSKPSVLVILQKLEKEYNQFKEIERKYKLIAPIEEISPLETEECPLSEKYKAILANKDTVLAEYQRMPKNVKQLSHTVVQLATSYFALSNQTRTADKLKFLEAALKKVEDSYEAKFEAQHIFRLITD